MLIVTCAALFAVGCSGSSESAADETSLTTSPAQSSSAQQTPQTRIPRGTQKVVSLRSPPPAEKLPAFAAVKIANANLPAGLAAARDGRILYSEFWGGRIRIIRPNGTVDPKPWADVNRLYGIRWTRFYHGGLSGIAFDPEFERNRFVYVVTQTPSKRNGLPTTTLILRFKEVAGRGTSPRVLYRIRAKVFDNVYSLVFGPDGTLFIPSGFLGTSRRPKARIRSRIGAERSSASRETLHRPVTTRTAHVLHVFGQAGSRTRSTSRSFPGARSRWLVRAGQKLTTRSTS